MIILMTDYVITRYHLRQAGQWWVLDLPGSRADYAGKMPES